MDITLKLQSSSGKIKMVGKDTVHVKREELGSSAFFIILDKDRLKERKTKLYVDIYSNGKKIESIATTFLGTISRKTKN